MRVRNMRVLLLSRALRKYGRPNDNPSYARYCRSCTDRLHGSDESALPNMSRSYSEHNEKFFMILILTFSTFDRSMLNWVLTVFNSDILLHIGLYIQHRKLIINSSHWLTSISQ